MIEVKKCNDQTKWDNYVLEKGGHPMQLWGWGEVKAAHGWRADRVFVCDGEEVVAAAQLLIRHLPWPLKNLVYIPRGPVATSDDYAFLNDLADYAKQKYQPVAMTIEPDWTDVNLPSGWRRSKNSILMSQTIILDLTQSQDELLADMAKKTRQYIRKSAIKTVEVRQVKDRAELTACLDIYKQTAKRAGFSLHADQYYYDVFDKLGDHSPVFAAFQNGQPLAFLWLAISQLTAFELYGGMNLEGQHLRVNYALKWHAIKTVKRWGIARYDLNGLLEGGVSSFKKGFASHQDQLIGIYEKSLSPFYWIWDKGLPLAKILVRAYKSLCK